jgi:SAM-dependent methyltransferase
MIKHLRKIFRGLILKTDKGYRSYLTRTFGTSFPPPTPVFPLFSTVLRTNEEHQRCTSIVRSLCLPSHYTPEKNWDSLIALKTVLENVPHSSPILDAGGTTDSVILPWLFAYGYKDLTAINLSIKQPFRYGAVRYCQGDLTHTQYPSGHFKCIICQSVIEHGVDTEDYLREMSRLLCPGGYLVTSTDYWVTPIDTASIRAFGAPFRVFTPAAIRVFVAQAALHGLEPAQDISYGCGERAVTWEEFGLSYTFFCLVLRKKI